MYVRTSVRAGGVGHRHRERRGRAHPGNDHLRARRDPRAGSKHGGEPIRGAHPTVGGRGTLFTFDRSLFLSYKPYEAASLASVMTQIVFLRREWTCLFVSFFVGVTVAQRDAMECTRACDV